jgi:hypothetical protein
MNPDRSRVKPHQQEKRGVYYVNGLFTISYTQAKFFRICAITRHRSLATYQPPATSLDNNPSARWACAA